jgi:hypothetical protein
MCDREGGVDQLDGHQHAIVQRGGPGVVEADVCGVGAGGGGRVEEKQVAEWEVAF